MKIAMRTPCLLVSMLLLAAPVLHSHAVRAQDPAADNTAAAVKRLHERDAADAKLLMPQAGLGGTTNTPAGKRQAMIELPIGEPGCEKMTGYIQLPDPMPAAGKKVALIVAFHGNGDVGKARVGVFASAHTDRDPIIACGVQYQQTKEGGGGEFNAPTLASGQKILDGAAWLMKKVMAEYPIDPERVFVGGFSWGTAWASNLALQAWRDSPATFPFRGVFLCGSPAYATSKAQVPPVPWIFTHGSKETDVVGNNIVQAVRQVANRFLAWGITTGYHEIPGMGHAMNGQVVTIIRETINQLGGPGLDTATIKPAGANASGSPAAPEREPLSFEASDDTYVKEIVGMCNDDEWVAALARIEEIMHDRNIPSRDKREVRYFKRDVERAARAAFPATEAALQAAAEKQVFPSSADEKRLRAIVAAFADATWLKGREHPLEVLDRFGDDFPPRVRERERAAAMTAAWKLEASDRSAAKAAYKALAERASEDGGTSVWPRAAEYRLGWWLD